MTDCHDDGTRQVATLDTDWTVALVGSPNAGKTTLFNALTGMRAKTANYPGVTVSRREGVLRTDGAAVTVVDLPGTYGLQAISPDEEIVTEALQGHVAGTPAPDGLLMVADATTLARSLLLVADLLRLDLPSVLVLTMTDEVAGRGGRLDIGRLSDALGITVLPVVGHRGVGVEAVRRQLAVDPREWPRPLLAPPDDIAERAAWVDSVVAAAVDQPGPQARTDAVDRVLLHPVAGVVVFAVVMLLFFQAIFTLATPLADTLDGWVGSFGSWVGDVVPGRWGELLANGVIAGVGGVLVFVPQIALLFLIIGFLEKVGYLSRAAFLADRVLGRFGLEGRSFISLLSSFACAVPGILSTRSIPNERRRIATMLAAPLMTCSARLPVYTVLVAAFVSDRRVLGPLRLQGLTMFGLYLLGAVSGLLYAAVVSRFTGVGPSAPVLLEMAPYRRPTARALVMATWDGVWSFVRKAGTVILLTTVVLWVLLNIPSSTAPAQMDAASAASYRMEHSIAGRAGTALETVTAPLGFEWRINVALIGSLAAREVFVSTLAQTTAAQDEGSLADRLRVVSDSNGDRIFNGATVAAILVFFVYALQCFSTIAVLRRETNGWKWPVVAFTSMLALAYVGALVAHTVVAALS